MKRTMASFYIQGKDELVKISGDLTLDGIVEALGYTPSDFSGNFNDLTENPFREDMSGELNITDENGNVIAKIDANGLHTLDVIAGDHTLSNKADVSYVDEKFNNIEIPEIPDVDFTGLATESWVEGKGYLTEHQDISHLASKDEVPSIEGLATESFVITKVAEAKLEGSDVTIPVQDVKVNGTTVIKNMVAEIDLTPYSLKTEVPSVDGLASEQWVEDKGYLTEHQDISNLASKTEVQESIEDIDFYSIQNNPILDGEPGTVTFVDDNGFIGMKLLEDGIYVKDVIAGDHILSKKADKEDIADLASKEFVTTKISDIEIPVIPSNLATQEYVDEKVGAIEIPDVDFTGLATEAWVEDKGYLTEHQDISHLASKDEIPSLDGYATKKYVEGKNYITEADVPIPEFNTLSGNPIIDDETAEFNIIDEDGNVGLKLTEDGLFVKDVISGEHILSNKADREDLDDFVTKEYMNEQLSDITIPELDNYATKEFVEDKHYITLSEVPTTEFNELVGNPIAEDTTDELNIIDDNGYIGLKLGSDGLYVKDVIAGNHILSNKADLSEVTALRTLVEQLIARIEALESK